MYEVICVDVRLRTGTLCLINAYYAILRCFWIYPIMLKIFPYYAHKNADNDSINTKKKNKNFI